MRFLVVMRILKTDHRIATAEFDQLCFDYGLELDEDVGYSFLTRRSTLNEAV